MDSLVSARGLTKRFGAARALEGVDLDVRPGETLAVVGHNGAGKSTLMHLLAGVFLPTSGELVVGGVDVTGHYSVREARSLGLRIVYQELSLCGNLNVAENFRITHPTLRGPGWRVRARDLARSFVHDIWPDADVPFDLPVATLPIGTRHMVEIARATSVLGDEAIRVLILDEPTASLDATTADQLFDWLHRKNRDGLAAVFISHRLSEIEHQADRVVVLRDGHVSLTGVPAKLSRDEIVRQMGETGDVETTPPEAAEEPASEATQGGATAAYRRPTTAAARSATEQPVVRAENLNWGPLHGVNLVIRPGEVVGLGGLEGHGQYELLIAVFESASRRLGGAVDVHGRAAFVSGDRGREGIFPMFAVAENITASSLPQLSVAGLFRRASEVAHARRWVERLAIRTQSVTTPILSLSGGSQQKALVARALATRADLILFNDPMRGVDVGTKRDLYHHVREEAASGRAFLWYTTENAELENCDRVYVMRRGRIVTELAGEELSEEAVLRASFQEVEHVG